MYVHENGLFSVEDQEVMLQDLSLSAPVAPSSLPPPPSLSGGSATGEGGREGGTELYVVFLPPARWLMVEGVPVETQGVGTITH